MKKTLNTLTNIVIFAAIVLLIYAAVYSNVTHIDLNDIPKANYFMAVEHLGIQALFAIVGALCVKVIIYIKD